MNKLVNAAFGVVALAALLCVYAAIVPHTPPRSVHAPTSPSAHPQPITMALPR